MENCWVLKCMHLKFRTRVAASLYFFNSWNVYLSILSPELYFQTSWLNLYVKRKNTSHRQAVCEKNEWKKSPKRICSWLNKCKCLTSSVFGEVDIEATVKYSSTTRYWLEWSWSTRNSQILWMRMQIGTSSLGNSLALSNKLKAHAASTSFPLELCTWAHRETQSS